MICVCLNSNTLKKNNYLLQINQQYADLFELRVDFLNKNELYWENIKQWKQNISVPGIFTIREKHDRGYWESNNIQQKKELIIKTLELSLFEYVDIELYNKELQEQNSFILEAYNTTIKKNSTSKIILSQHRFDTQSKEKQNNIHNSEHNTLSSFSAEDLIQDIQYYAKKYPFSIIKYAIQCTNSADFYQFLIASKELQKDSHDYILIPMGSFGIPARIISHLSASLWTYCIPDTTDAKQSSSELLQKLGQISASQLDTLYRYHELQLSNNKNIPVFAVIGNPVLHSISPHYFNILFKKQNKKAVYIHLHTDDITYITKIAKLMNIKGMSVTVPHKSNIIPTLQYTNPVVQACSACNTVLCTPTEWKGYNTDVFGLLHPLLQKLATPYKKKEQTFTLESYHNLLKGKKCLIIGAGGSAKSATYALQLCGAEILISNRNIENAKKLIQHFSSTYISYCSLQDYNTMQKWNLDIIIQTTSVGMMTNISPLPKYPFLGKETVYDIIYTPSETKFLSEAKNHGCSIINGSTMFSEQAKEQAKLFLQMIKNKSK